MDISKFSEIVELLSARADSWNTLWDVYKVIAVAIVGAIASGKILKGNRKIASLIAIIGFLAFSYGNYKALDEMRKQREALVSYVINFVELEKDKENETESFADNKMRNDVVAFARSSLPPTEEKLKIYHGLLDAFVVMLLFFLPQFQQTHVEDAVKSEKTNK